MNLYGLDLKRNIKWRIVLSQRQELGLTLCGVINGYMKRRTDGELREEMQPSLFQDLGGDERCDCIHGGGDERNELLGILPMRLAAVLC